MKRYIYASSIQISDEDCRNIWNQYVKHIRQKWGRTGFTTPDFIVYITEDEYSMIIVYYKDVCELLKTEPDLYEKCMAGNLSALELSCGGDTIPYDEAVKLYEQHGKRVPYWLRKAAYQDDYRYEQ